MVDSTGILGISNAVVRTSPPQRVKRRIYLPIGTTNEHKAPGSESDI